MRRSSGRQRRRTEAAPSQPTGKSRRAALKESALRSSHFWLQRFGLAVLLLAALFSAVNVLSLSPTAQVIQLGDQTTFLHSRDTYQAAANRLLASSIWNRNKITVDTGHISQELLKQFPELDSVSVTLPLLAHRPLVYVEPFQPVLIMTGSNGSFVIGTSGKALIGADSPAALPKAKLPVVTDQSGLELALNKQALPSTTVDFIQQIIAQLTAKHFKVAGLTLPPAASELDVQLTGQPYKIKFNLHNGDRARQQAGTFLATIAQLQKQSITPAQYVDVRVPGRAYYQ